MPLYFRPAGACDGGKKGMVILKKKEYGVYRILI
jgi:hypothetical protein